MYLPPPRVLLLSIPTRRRLFISQRPLTIMAKRRTLGVPCASTREWKLPAMLFWLQRRRAIMLEDQGDVYECQYRWKRRLASIDRQIEQVEAELAALGCNIPAPVATIPPHKIQWSNEHGYQHAA
jgi:hypothetical protein